MDRRLALVALLLSATGCSGGVSELTIPVADDRTGTTSSPSTQATDPETTASSANDEPQVQAAGPAPIEPLLGSYRVEVVATYPHDPDAFTQGLEWHDGALLESTGQYGESDRRRVDLETGAVELEVPLDDELFGEGLTVVGDEILQLTWQENELQRAQLSDLSLTSTQRYSGEGWGLCYDGEHVVMSNGSATLTRRNADTFEIVGELGVTANGSPVPLLNELECFGGQIVANVYGLDSLAVIDAETGIVAAVVDASVLRPDGFATDDADTVLNGVARHPETGNWFLTGKRWPVLYEVEFVSSD